jgi:hypothetical protein
MNVFSVLKIYAGKWNEADVREFTQEEIENVTMAVVVPSQYGDSVQMTLKGGGLCFIPLENTAVAAVGEIIDLSKAKLVTLSKDGEKDIYRVRI